MGARRAPIHHRYFGFRSIMARTLTTMEELSAFSVGFLAGNMTAVVDKYSDREKSPNGTVKLSKRDRSDAARLLTLLLSEERRRDVDLVNLAEAIIEDRRRRSEIFNPSMFGEPSWELLLTLFVMDQRGPRLTIGRLAQAANIRLTTALRWLDYLEDQNLIRRELHPRDARTAFIELTDKARDSLRLYLSETLTPNL
jgi:DNA-binding MarR family transcriptional regulator